MKTNKFIIFAILMLASFVLTGCKFSTGGSGSTGSSSGSSSYVDSSFSSSSIGGSSSLELSGDALGGIPHNPEPATMALMATGLLGYGLVKSRKKKKK